MACTLPPIKQRVLLRDQQTAVEGNLGPAARREQGIVEGAAIGAASSTASSFGFGDLRAGYESACGRRNVRFERELAAGESGERHADHAFDDAAWKPLRAFSASRAPRSTQLARRRFS
jgi:hypothetical protein